MFAPTSFFPELFESQMIGSAVTPLLDLQADTGVTVSNTDKVDTWADQSGHGFNFTQTGSARPALASIGGYPCIQFGIGIWLLGQNWAALDNLDSFTVNIVSLNYTNVAICKIANEFCSDPGCTGWSALMGNIVGLNNNSFFSLYNSTSDYIYRLSTTLQTGLKRIDTFDVVSRSEIHSYFNGALNDTAIYTAGSGAGNYSTTEPLRIGIDGALGSCDSWASGYLFSIRIDSPALNAVQRPAVIQAAANRYGVVL